MGQPGRLIAPPTGQMDPARPQATTSSSAPALELAGISKTFGRTRVLTDASFAVGRGEIVALVGRNGSGKSTLIKVLSGYHAPDPGGRLSVRGREVALPLAPDDPASLGFGFMHQDLGLSPELSVLENVRVGRFETGRFGRIRWRREREHVRRALADFDADIPPDAAVRDLTELDRALVALVRSLMALEEHDGGLLVLDEPTAFMPRDDVQRLFAAVRRAAERGTGVIFVSHRFDEVLDLSDRVVVLRDGKLVASTPTAETDEDTLVELVLGRRLDGYYPETAHTTRGGAARLVVEGVSGQVVKDASLELQPGEVVGLTGLRGMGHEELPYLVYGARKAVAGHVTLGDERRAAASMTPPRSVELGAVLVPADRQHSAVVPEFAIRENVSQPVVSRYFRGGWIRRREEQEAVASLLDEFEVRPPDPSLPVGSLSGGNQQKMLLAKWLQSDPTVHLFHEPTAGVDVGAKRAIFERIEQIAAAGGSVLVSSEEWADLAHICDRVLVFRDGHISGPALAGDDCTEDRIAERCYRAGGRSATT